MGVAGAGRRLSLPSDHFVFRDLTLSGSVTYTVATWARMVGLLAERLVDLEPIVSHRFPLDQYEEAFRLMDDRSGVVAKIVLHHRGG
jgi:threonine dehydrogenase-like Zn-dependent dehydrogenase